MAKVSDWNFLQETCKITFTAVVRVLFKSRASMHSQVRGTLMAVETALVAREKERNAASRSIVAHKENQLGFSPLEEGLLRGNVFLCGRKTRRKRRRRMGRENLPMEGRLERRVGRVETSPREWRRVGEEGGRTRRQGRRRGTGRTMRMRQLQDERIELKEAPPGMRKYWCTIVRENYKMLLGRPGDVVSADKRKEVIARLGQVLGQGRGGEGGRAQRKLSLPISILSPGKPTLTKGPASETLVTKSSIKRRFWTDPRRIHHDHQGIHYDLGGTPRNHHPRNQNSHDGRPQNKLRRHEGALMADAIVAELKRDHLDLVGHQMMRPEVSQVLWGSPRGGRRIWQQPDSQENYISQEVIP